MPKNSLRFGWIFPVLSCIFCETAIVANIVNPPFIPPYQGDTRGPLVWILLSTLLSDRRGGVRLFASLLLCQWCHYTKKRC